MTWLLNGFLALLLIAGFAKLSTVIVNWLLAIPQPKWRIGLTELIQIVCLVIYSILTVRMVRDLGWQPFSGQRLANGFETIFVFSGVIGLLLLIRSALAYQMYRPPACEISADSQLVDLRKESGSDWTQTLVGPRPMRPIALLPGNQQFKLEVSTKTYAVPRLPENWNGLSIVQFADLHFRGAVTRRYFELVCEQAAELKPDLFVFTGDLLDDFTLLDWLPETLGRLDAPLGKYFILGNHDWYIDEATIRAEFVKAGWTSLAGQIIELKPATPGPSILVAGDETPWMGSHPDWQEESDQFRILLSHTPDNIDWARTHQVDLMLAGHTHGGQIRLPVLGQVYSPSRFGCEYASGVFWRPPTLLYVSRGVSGREPIRYNCPPELTKLVLTRG